MTIRCDALIVGGGPAGLAAAIALRHRGLDVLLADAQQPPIDKACGEGIMPDSRRDLAKLGVTLPDGYGWPFEGIRFCDEQSSVSADFPYGRGIGVRRTVLHSLLADRADDAGARFAWSSTVAAHPGKPIALNGETVQYKYLIGADGQTSRVRAWAGLERGSILTRRYGFRIHYRVAQWSARVEVHWAAAGQAYVTPVAGDEVCVSVMTRSPKGARSEAMIDSIPELRQRLRGASIISSERGALTTTRRLRRVTHGNVALAGDASGSADAVTGEGMALGFRQALALGDAIGGGDFLAYEETHAGILKLPQTMARILVLMDGSPRLRSRALKVLARDPALFQALLNVHVGEEPIHQFLVKQAPGFAMRLLLPV